MAIAALAVLLVIGVAACTESESGASDSRKRCTDVREHVVTLRASRLGAPGGGNPLAGEIDKHKRAMSRALGDAYIDRCEKRGASYADCVLAAGDGKALAACEKGQK